MWRALFSAIGIMMLILGVEFMLVDEAVFADSFLEPRNKSSYDFSLETSELGAAAGRNFSPPVWAPYSLLSSGAVVLLYSLGMRPRG